MALGASRLDRILQAREGAQTTGPEAVERDAPPNVASVSPPASPWHSPGACAALIATGKRSARRAGTIRLGTWNIRWFPDGSPGKRARVGEHAPGPTHVDWLACAIAWMRVDALAVQEIKATPRAKEALGALCTRLDQLTGGRWQVQIDRCPGGGRQHVGLLYDAARLHASPAVQLDTLNPHGGACDGQLRPGLGAYFRRPGGADFHFVSVHLKSGVKRRDYGLRRRSLQGLAAAYRRAQDEAPDADVVIAGDFNTMGCGHCSPSIASTAELGNARAAATESPPAFRFVDASPPCSEYHRGKPGLLDHFAVTRAMREVPAAARAAVQGYCADARCRPLGGAPPRAYYELSDHCPVVLDLDARDLD